MKHKRSYTNESARDPHNMIASFVSQCGILGGIVALFALLYPMLLLWKRRNLNSINAVLFWGELAFLLHSLMEVNLMIPASMAISGTLLICGLLPERAIAIADAGASQSSHFRRVTVSVLWLIGLFLALGAWYGNDRVLQFELRMEELRRLCRPEPAEQKETPPSEEQVRNALRKLQEIRPQSPFPWEMASDYFLSVRQLPYAEYCLDQAYKRSPGRPSIQYRFLQLEIARRNKDQANRHYLQLLNMFPSNPDYHKLNWLIQALDVFF